MQARAWLAFAQATPSPSEQLEARQAALTALAALETLAPEAQVRHGLVRGIPWPCSLTHRHCTSTPVEGEPAASTRAGKNACIDNVHR
jgi:hypothetical protein